MFLLIEIILIISIGIILLSYHKRSSDPGVKKFVNRISIIKDIIKGEWTLSPDRWFSGALEVGGKYNDREISFKYAYGCEGSPPYVRLKIKARINLKEISFADQKVLSSYFGGSSGFSLDNYLVYYMIPSDNFFNSENIKNLLDIFLIIAESIENKNINNAINVWKIISEKKLFTMDTG